MCWMEVGERRQEHTAMRETGNKVRSMIEEREMGINLVEQSQQNEAVPIHNPGDPCPHQEVFISD